MKKLLVAAVFAAGACVALADETYEFEETFKQQVESQKKADEEAEKARKEQEERDKEWRAQQAKYHDRTPNVGLMLGIGSGFVAAQYKGVDLDKQTPFSLQVGLHMLTPYANNSMWDLGLGFDYEGFYGSAKGDREVKQKWHFWGVNLLADMNLFNRNNNGSGLGFVAGLGYGYLSSSVLETVTTYEKITYSKSDWVTRTHKRSDDVNGWYYNLGVSFKWEVFKILFSYKIPTFQAQDFKNDSVMSVHIQLYFGGF